MATNFGKSFFCIFYLRLCHFVVHTKQILTYTRTINKPHLPYKTGLDVMQSPTAQDAFRPTPGLISCTGVTGRWGLLSHAQNAVRWLALCRSQQRLMNPCFKQTNHKLIDPLLHSYGTHIIVVTGVHMIEWLAQLKVKIETKIESSLSVSLSIQLPSQLLLTKQLSNT